MVSDKQSTDTIVRVTARDLLLILRTFEQSPESTLENVRLRLCHDRKMKRRGTFLWSTARDIISELDRLGYVKGVSSPKTSRHFEEIATAPVHLTDDGRALLASFTCDKGAAYDALFAKMYDQHPYLQALVGILREQPLLAPVVSSMKEHISDRYTSTSILAEDVVGGAIEVDGFLERLSQRIQCPLTDEQKRDIREGITGLLRDAALSAAQEELPRFAKIFMEKLNHIVIPALFRGQGIGFDYRTHRTLWGLGEEFRLWCITRSHPDYDGWLVYPTATIELSDDGRQITKLIFDSGLTQVRERFLGRLYDAYQKLQSKRGTTYVAAWELRAVFCVDNRCQKSAFNRVFAENYLGSNEHRLHLEIQRNKPQHEEVVRAGDRNIGSVRVLKQ